MTDPQLSKLRAALESAIKSLPPWGTCPHCGGPPAEQEVRNYDMTWGDGDVYCLRCGGFVRDWDRD